MHPHHRLDPGRIAERRRAGQGGFTLIELLAALVILGVIIVPLTGAIMTSFRVAEQTDASLTMSTGRSLLAFRFSRDVAAVDVAGVSTDPDRACNKGSGGSLFVTLNTTRLVSNGTTSSPRTNRVSYWITGSGKNIAVSRRACDGVTAGSAASGGREVDLATKLGNKGDVGTTVVHTAYDEAAARYGPPCSETRCQMEIDGRYRNRFVAQRRVFGAGVPLQVGRVYASSSETYDLRNYLGVIDGKEVPAVGELSLAPGLDGPPNLQVTFQIQQSTTQKWLNATGTAFDATATSADTAPSVKATYGDAAAKWFLDTPMGPGKLLDTGGAYRVFTTLTSCASFSGSTCVGPSPKRYGGVKGFPLWIDWKPDDSVVVQPGGTGTGFPTDTGEITSAGTNAPAGSIATAMKAMRTYNNALLVSNPNNKPFKDTLVLSATADFNETVNIVGPASAGTTSAFPDHQTVVGGHDAKWLRGSRTTVKTKIVGTGGIGLTADVQKDQRFRNVAIDSGDAPAAAGSSTYAVKVSGTGELKFEWSTITARPGRDGSNGTVGSSYGGACRGGDGVAKNTNAVTGRSQVSGGEPCIGDNVGNGRAGGNGGPGGTSSLTSANDGGNGGRGGGALATAAAAGTGGKAGFCGSLTGTVGGGGVSGAKGTKGSTASFVVNNSGWTGGTGLAGGTGTDGRGGGGSGGGGANNCFGVNSAGASGGSGGEGGRAGTGGTGGGPGGGSFGIYVTGISSTSESKVDLFETVVTSGKGGKGGNGGAGGAGANGGVGGKGAFNGIQGADSGGGGGGAGGGGGGGGAAGQAGPSYPIFTSQPGGIVSNAGSNPTAGVIGDNGTGGEGGAGGKGGGGGPGADTTVDFFFFDVRYTSPSGLNGGAGFPGETGDVPSKPPTCLTGKATFSTPGTAVTCV